MRASCTSPLSCCPQHALTSSISPTFLPSPRSAWLSRSWLPDEVINVDFMPERIKMPRRQAFRYVKIEVIDTSLRYKVRCVPPVPFPQRPFRGPVYPD